MARPETQRHIRATMSAQELLQYQGKWVAFSANGTRLFASAERLADLDPLIIAAGEDPEWVGFEQIYLQDICLGGVEVELVQESPLAQPPADSDEGTQR